MERIINEIKNSIETKKKLIQNRSEIEKIYQASQICKETIFKGHKVMLAGNGGSAADSQHISAEFVSKYKSDSFPLASIALTTDTSIITAIGNDYGFKHIFSRQIIALGKKGDLFIGITTSGKSENILKAFKTCHEKKINTIALTGKNGIAENYQKYVDIEIKVPSDITARIQETHILIGHMICGYVEEDYLI